MLAPLLVVDRYRRVDLRRRDGQLVLALTRGTIRTARRLERGRPVCFPLPELRFSPRAVEAGEMDRMRWFLREGWGDEPHYSLDDAVMHETRASLLLPSLGPRDLELVLALSAGTPTTLRVTVNGTPVGEATLVADAGKYSFYAPATALFRGDNEVQLTAEPPASRPRLHSFSIRPVVPGSRSPAPPSESSWPGPRATSGRRARPHNAAG